MTLSRESNGLVLAAGTISTTTYGEGPNGERIALDADGNLRLETGDSIVVEGDGFAPEAEVEVWMFSTPTLLGILTADSRGTVEGRFVLPVTFESGDHRLVLSGATSDEIPVVLSLGLKVGAIPTTLWSGIPIWIPVSIAILLAVLIPTRYSRRRQDSTSG